MIARLRHAWGEARASFWMVPGAMVLAAIGLAALTLWVDQSWTGDNLPGWVYAGGPDGARSLLSTVAGSIVTVAGVGFSITIVALVLASTQFGPRLLTLFMRDLTSQVTLGTFTGTFAYCVLVLRTIVGRDEAAEPFVPQLSITVAVGLTMLSVGALVYFFHHVAVSIQAPRLLATVGRDLDRAIDRLYPREAEEAAEEGPAGEVPGPEDGVVRAPSSGYVQVVDDSAVMDAAVQADARITLLVRPGLFVVENNPIAYVRPAGGADDVEDALRRAVLIGDVRTAEDDIEFSIRQLVEVALRALSPSINDPFTAMGAVDWLGSALAKLARREWHARFRTDDDGTLRVVADVSTFRGIAHTIFSRIRHYGGTSPMLLNRLLEAVAAIGPHMRHEGDRRLVAEEVEAILRMGRDLIRSDADLQELERRHRAALAALGRRT